MQTAGKTGLYPEYLVETCRNYEYFLMSGFDTVIALTHDDQKRIQEAVPGTEVIVSPFPVLTTDKKAGNTTEWAPEKLVFLGSEYHRPNKDGVEWFITGILPLVKHAGIKLFITGVWSEETKLKYSMNPAIIFTGFVDDLSELVKNGIGIVPVRIGGGGIRSKIIESMSFGLPVITTRLGVAGVLAENDREILIRNTEKDFADAIDWVIDHTDASRQIIKNGLDIIHSHYTYEVTGRQKLEFLNKSLEQKAMLHG